MQLSILIISYNRSNDLLELLGDITRLQQKETLLKEVIVINNKSTEDYKPVEDFIALHPQVPFRYTVAPENGGVSKGRNMAMKMATGTHLFLLDDDVLLPDDLTLVKFRDFFESAFATEKNVGIVTPAIWYSATNEPQKTAFPHKDFEKYYGKEKFLTGYYVGAGHVIKKEVLDKTGLLPEDFFYGMEEYDLSMRAVNAGYALAYTNTVKILHKESPAGRIPNADKLRMMWHNKAMVWRRYLPARYLYSAAVLWSLFYLKNAGFKGWISGWKNISKVRKAPVKKLSNEALDYLKKVGFRFWY